jgi:hypothetical protein
MNKLDHELKKKISGCGIFVVLSTKNYLKSLKESDENIMTQISIARELKKPFLIIEDSRMLQQDLEETRKYFSNDNVVDRLTIDIGNKNFTKLVAKKIRDVVRMYCPDEVSIGLVTGYSDDKD